MKITLFILSTLFISLLLEKFIHPRLHFCIESISRFELISQGLVEITDGSYPSGPKLVRDFSPFWSQLRHERNDLVNYGCVLSECLDIHPLLGTVINQSLSSHSFLGLVDFLIKPCCWLLFFYQSINSFNLLN